MLEFVGCLSVLLFNQIYLTKLTFDRHLLFVPAKKLKPFTFQPSTAFSNVKLETFQIHQPSNRKHRKLRMLVFVCLLLSIFIRRPQSLMASPRVHSPQIAGSSNKRVGVKRTSKRMKEESV